MRTVAGKSQPGFARSVMTNRRVGAPCTISGRSRATRAAVVTSPTAPLSASKAAVVRALLAPFSATQPAPALRMPKKPST